MGTKNNPSKYDCYNKAKDDEPVFVLLGRDPHAPALVEAWAQERDKAIRSGECPSSDWDKVTEALKCARDMRLYQNDVNHRS